MSRAKGVLISMQPASLMESALRLADARSWAVFPLAERSKIPAIQGGRGCLDATNDLYTIREWWAVHPAANIGVATGPASRVFVLDVDAAAPKTGGMTGPAALAELERRHGALPDTLTASTGGGGEHRYFRWPEGRQLRNRARIKIDGVATALDSRAEGGYVAAPPSVHPSGAVYAWTGPVREPVEAPAWLLDLLCPAIAAVAAVAAPGPRPAFAAGPNTAGDTYGRAALDGACADIQASGEGARHETIRNKSLWIARLVAGGCVNQGEAERALIAAGEATGKDPREVARAVAWGFERGMADPYRPEPREYRPAVQRRQTPPDPMPGDDAPVDYDLPDDSHDDAPMPRPARGYRESDVGNAQRLADRFGKNIRWCANMPGDGLLVWDGNRWRPDELKKTMALAQAVAMDIVEDADQAWALVSHLEAMAAGTVPVDDPMTLASRTKAAKARAKKLAAWATASEMSARLKAMIEVALPDLAVLHAGFDADHYLLNAYGGTLNLREGDVYPARRGDLITKIAGVGVEADASATECPQWLAFLDRIMGGDQDMIGFLQRAVGYSLTGSIKEQCLFVCYGATGGNGKSTFLDVIRAVAGDYAVHTRADTFMKDARKSGIPNDIAALRGARLVTASEPEQGAVLDESIIKEMTGDNAMTARFLNREFFTFTPTFKVWLATNHRPIIRSTGRATWRRMMLIPFEVTIPEGEWDRGLLPKLLAERDAILLWAVRGCGDWQFGSPGVPAGLRPPTRVTEATNAYRADMDILGEFLAEKCVVGEGERVANADLYRAFASWQRDNGEPPRSHRWLTRALQDRAYRKEERKDTGYRWEGIGLREVASIDPQPGRWPDRGAWQ